MSSPGDHAAHYHGLHRLARLCCLTVAAILAMPGAPGEPRKRFDERVRLVPLWGAAERYRGAMDEAVLEAARGVRPYLAEFIGPAAADVDAELAGLLADADAGGDVEGGLRELLEAHQATRVFLE